MFVRETNEVAHGRGGKALKELFVKAGIGAKEQTKILSGSDGLNEVLLQTAKRIQLVGHASSTQQALFTKLWGVRAGQAALSDLARGPEAIKKMQARFRELAGVMSDEDALKLRGMKNRLHDVGVSFDAIKMRAVLAFGPSLLALVERVTSFLTSHGEQIKNVLVGAFTAIAFAARVVMTALSAAAHILGWFEDHPYVAAAAVGFLAVMFRAQLEAAIRGVIVQVMRLALFELPSLLAALWSTATVIGGALVTGLAYLGGIIFAVVIPAISSAIAATWAWTAALLSNPIFLLATSIVAAVVLIHKYWDPIAGFFNNIFDGIYNAGKRAFDFIANLPVVKQLLELLDKIDDLTNFGGGGGGGNDKGSFGDHHPWLSRIVGFVSPAAKTALGLDPSLMQSANSQASKVASTTHNTSHAAHATTVHHHYNPTIKADIKITDARDPDKVHNEVHSAMQKALRHAASASGYKGD